MSFHGKKILPPFNWAELDPPLQTKILQDATRRFVMQSEQIILCFERPMHPKLLLFPAQLIITYQNPNGDNVLYKWTNVFQIKFEKPDTSSSTQGWWFKFYCNNKSGTSQINIFTKFLPGNFAREALILGLTGSLRLRHKYVDKEDVLYYE
jgi:hypothetical protein